MIILSFNFFEQHSGFPEHDCYLWCRFCTAEAVSVGFSAVLHAYYYDEGKVNAGHIVSNMLGSGVKDSVEDLKKIRHYFDQVAAYRNGHAWSEFYQSKKLLNRNS